MSRRFPGVAVLLAAFPAVAQASEAHPVEAARTALIQEAGRPRGKPAQAAVDRLEALGLLYLDACNHCASLKDCDADRKKILAGRPPAQDPCAPPPSNREGHGLLERGIAEVKARRPREATVFLKRAADAGVVEAHMHLGACYAQLGRTREGAWQYEEFLMKAPGAPQAASVREILRSYYATSRTRPRHPHLLDASSRLPILPPSPKPGSREQALRDAALAKGLEWIKAKKYRQAIGPLQDAARLGANVGHLYLGIAYASLGESDRGAWHYEEFVHLEPGHPSVPKAREILREFFTKSRNRKPRYPQ